MKRKADISEEQPSPKKPDAPISTDLRSKIGAKLQTLLNGMNSDSPLFIQYKKQLYADLFREPQYSEIIIDPTIVVKAEPDSEQSTDSVAYLSSESFLNSAKSRLTQLLNKQRDSEKENTKTCIPTASEKSKPATDSKSLRSKSKTVNVSESCNSTYSEVLINQGQMQSTSAEDKNMCSPKKSKKTKASHAHSQHPKTSPRKVKAQSASKSSQPKCGDKNSGSETCSSVTEITKSASSERLDNNVEYPDILCLSEQERAEEEAVDGPEVCLTVEENVELVLKQTDKGSVPSCDSDEDVIFWCEKKPTYDVITIEEEEDASEIVEELHKCNQCGKTFRARSLLNFHLKMHGTTSFQAPL